MSDDLQNPQQRPSTLGVLARVGSCICPCHDTPAGPCRCACHDSTLIARYQRLETATRELLHQILLRMEGQKSSVDDLRRAIDEAVASLKPPTVEATAGLPPGDRQATAAKTPCSHSWGPSIGPRGGVGDWRCYKCGAAPP